MVQQVLWRGLRRVPIIAAQGAILNDARRWYFPSTHILSRLSPQSLKCKEILPYLYPDDSIVWRRLIA